MSEGDATSGRPGGGSASDAASGGPGGGSAGDAASGRAGGAPAGDATSGRSGDAPAGDAASGRAGGRPAGGVGAGAAMRSDMAAQPAVLRALGARRGEVAAALAGRDPAGIVVVARGSSDYAAVFGRYVLEAATGRPVALAAPSLQTLYGVEPRLDGWLAIGVSQSGQTPEIVTVLERLARGGACAVAITNAEDSALARAAEVSIELEAGDERAVPATKTFTAELAAFALVAEALGPVAWHERDWGALPGVVEAALADPEPAERVAARLDGAGELACVARGYLFCVALEAALKLREAAAMRAEGWSSADFRHGPMTVAGADLPLLAISADGPAAGDVEELAERLSRSGVEVVRLSDRDGADLPYGGGLAEPLAAIPATVRAQQLALAIATRRGLDPDRPPGLAKVTPTR